MADMDLWPELSRIRARTLVIAASEDRAMTPLDGEATAEAIRDGGGDATATVIPDAAHLVNLAQPEVFTSLLLRHLSE